MKKKLKKIEQGLIAVQDNAQLPVLKPETKAPSLEVIKKKTQLPVVSSAGAALQGTLRAYLNEIKQFKLLDRQEEDRLVAHYKKTGDQESGRQLITANLRLVVKIAMDFQSHWLNNLLDLIQEGNVGLMQALRKFDPGRGVKFSYYASYWIKAYILKYIMDNWRLVKVGTTQAQRKLFYNLKKEQQKLLNEGLDPGPILLAERLGVQESEVREMDMRLSAGREMSLDAPIGPDSDQSQISLLPSPDEGAESFLAGLEMHDLLKKKLDLFKESLDNRELLILNKRLLAEDPVTLQEIGEDFGVSRERVRQLEERLKKRLAVFLRKEMPEAEL